MFGLLRDVGRYMSGASKSPIEQLSEPLGPQYQYGVAICFDRAGTYRGVKLVKGADGVIYKFGTPGGTDFTLVSRHSGTTKKVVKRLCKNASAILDADGGTKTHQLIAGCLASIENRIDFVAADVDRVTPEDEGRDKRVYVFWALLEDESVTGLFNFPEVQDHLVHAQLERYGSKRESRTPLKAPRRVCSVCGEQVDEVYGNFTDIACYNLDKPGLITGGFDYSQAPANFPICRTCILLVLAGKTFAEQHLTFRLAGLSYWLLPQALDPKLYDTMLESIREAETRQTLGERLKTLTDDDQEIFRYLTRNLETKKIGDLLVLNMVFFESKQAAWRIIAEIREVLPSRVKELLEAKMWIQGRDEMVRSKREREGEYRFTLKSIRPFCGALQKQSDKRFLSYVEAIFKGTRLDRRAVVKDLANGILASQKKNPDHAGFTVRDAWATYLFLSRIDAITNGGKAMQDRSSDNRYEAFLNDNCGFFRDVYTRTAFLSGCYVGAVLYVQRKARGSQPFAKKFLGRKLNRGALRDLYMQAETKLRQYDALGVVNTLSPLVAEAWIQSGKEWNLSDDETTFAFSLGVTLQPKLATKGEQDEKIPVKVET
jgi:CRISPR-associated Csh1 family protein